jgi:hypothetical protein
MIRTGMVISDVYYSFIGFLLIWPRPQMARSIVDNLQVGSEQPAYSWLRLLAYASSANYFEFLNRLIFLHRSR